MFKPLPIALACVLLIGGAFGLYRALDDDGSGDRGAARGPSGARAALLTLGGGPDGSALVALNRWRYRADPLDRGLSAGWTSGDWRGSEVRVPHSPNGRAHAGEAGRRAYAGSIGWYAREIQAPVAGQYSLQFESAHYRAQVYVDGRLLRSHTGAYEPFSARATLAPGRHTVAVRVDWRDPQGQSDEDYQRAWFNYGGLNRPVTLSRLGRSRLGALTLRTRLIGSGRARVDITLRVRNRADARRIQPTGSLERGGDEVQLRFDPLTVGRGDSKTARASVVLDDPALWSPSDPQRYALKIAVAGESALARSVGLREITWDGDGLYVNGDRIVLAGAALPPDARGHGDALTAADERRMIAGLRSLAANATRSQLPLSQRMLDRLDEAGIFVWQEIGPWEPAGRWRATTPALLAAARDRALRAAEEGQAHASILAWTLTNEAPGQGHPGQQRYVTTTARRLRAFDPGRPVAADLWGSQLPRSDGPLFAELDAIGVTDYIGWYERPLDGAQAQAALARKRIAKLRALFADKPLVVTELGAAGSARIADGRFGSLSFQARLLARRIRQLNAEPGVSGVIVWALRDYALRPDFVGGSVNLRVPGLTLVPGLNEKGLYDFAGRPKPALAAVREALRGG